MSTEPSLPSWPAPAVPGAAAVSHEHRSVRRSRELLERARAVIPGAAQTFSKGYDQHVIGVSPLFLREGRGCRVWDVDGNEYIDYVQGLLPNILGYAHPAVNRAVSAQLERGVSFSLPHPLEVELAERLVALIPCAEMVRFGKNGSDATSGALRAARAFTGRDRVACCGYHGWHDWYIGTTTRHAGVPRAVRELSHTFEFGDLGALEALLGAYPREFAAVILEPCRFAEPPAGYLDGVLRLAHAHGTLVVFDEICTGFHLGLGGAQRRFDVTPDLACFGKALGNGFPISCVLGRAEVMRTFEEAFFSFTFAGETASLAAALAVIDELERTDALERMAENGAALLAGFNALARGAGLEQRFRCEGFPRWSRLRFLDAQGRDSALERTLFVQEAARRGVLLLTTHNMTAAHERSDIDRTLAVYAEVFARLAEWLTDLEPVRFLAGPLIEPVFAPR